VTGVTACHDLIAIDGTSASSDMAPGPIGIGCDLLLFLHQVVTRFEQPIQLFALLRDAIGVTLLGLATRETGGLFYQLTDIVLKYRDTIVELGS
jgi:hypothetical protein